MKALGTLGPYEIVHSLASGESSELFVARRSGRQTQSKLAIKVLKRELSFEESHRRRFTREARIGLLVRHEHLVRAVDSGEADGAPFIAMEYLEGCDVRRIIRDRQGLDVSTTAVIGRAIAEALQEIHTAVDDTGLELGALHLAICPDHVFLTEDGGVKLLRFGTELDPRDLQTPVPGHDDSFNAPEWFIARAPLDQRTDVFSLGYLMLYMVTGRLLHWSPELLEKGMHDLRESLSKRFHVPGSFQDILLRAIADHPADRFQSAREMGDAINIFLLTQGGLDPRSAIRMLAQAQTSGWPMVSLHRDGLVAAHAPAERQMSFSDVTRGGSIDLPVERPPPRRLGWGLLTAGALIVISVVLLVLAALR